MLVASFRFHAGERISRLSRPYTTEVMTHECFLNLCVCRQVLRVSRQHARSSCTVKYDLVYWMTVAREVSNLTMGPIPSVAVCTHSSH